MSNRLTAAAEHYFADLQRIRASGGATGERSVYTPIANLLNAVGAALKPKVFCIGELADQGAGHPDFGLYTARQVQKGRPRDGHTPECGVVEVKSAGADAGLTAASEQVSRYRTRYHVVLVTNTREFVLVGEGPADDSAKLETFRLAADETDFDRRLETPRTFARQIGTSLGEYLSRALSHRAAIAEPRDLARLLASYARDGLSRVEAAGNAPALASVRNALEESLGVRFEGERGARFFRSTLVQTLFYGVFSAWVLWARQTPPPADRFNWHEAVWHLRAPVLRALFQQLSDPGRMQPLGLVEVLNWTAAALDRVDRPAFFAKFSEGEAVPYFYEPFLEAFDPDLRRQLGVWYTPAEVVRYMVARVDKALEEDLGVAGGLAADNVYVLDPCCGTGAYLAEVLRRIASNLERGGQGALTGARVKHAATKRVFGFEIMPAPFVVAHLQVGLTLRALGAPLTEEGDERAGIYLTNALTGWEPHTTKPLPFPELEDERDRAARVKQATPILVILGNPPYNGFAGMAVQEERELSDAYRVTKRVRPPEGRGLNDLYVRFFRMAERRIVEKTGCGVVCFISNYSWLDGLSYTGMRERYLEAFDAVRIDCLNGDKYKTGKTAPDGSPDPSIFSTPEDPVGIQVGTAIATMIRRSDHTSARKIGFRHLWGSDKPQTLFNTAHAAPRELYESVTPVLGLGLPFGPTAVSPNWFAWPALPDLFPARFHGVLTNRDALLVDTDLDRLKSRITSYFDAGLSHDGIARRYPNAMKDTAQGDARATRDVLLARGGPDEDGFVRFTYRPFDNRWLYWEAEALLDRPRTEYRPHVFDGNLWLSAAQHLRQGAAEPQVCFTEHLGSHHLIERGANLFPAWLLDHGLAAIGNGPERRANLSAPARRYLERLDASVEDLFYHVLAVLHDPAYREANADALRLGWPRIPLPAWPGSAVADDRADEAPAADHADEASDQAPAADALAASAGRGRELAGLLNPDTPVPGVTRGPLQPVPAVIAVPTTTDGTYMMDDDFAVTAGWGHAGQGRAVMPGQGRLIERDYSDGERAAIAGSAPALGDTTVDIYLNGRAFWRNVPTDVWRYRLGGYQVLKKWLSYRERDVIGRALRPDEIAAFSETARRIAAILSLH